MTITADSVKQLRERTGAGMMECKKALVETKGDLDAAAELMRKQGLAKADKKATRVAAEGVIVVEKSADGRTGAMGEINGETDFVDSGETVDERRRALIAKIGENISVRRSTVLTSDGNLGAYVHGTRIGALVAVKGGDAALAHDLAMHVAASNPKYLSQAQIPADVVAKERAILTEQAQGEGKPPESVAKMAEGPLRKSLGEITLAGQAFVKDPDMSIEKLLKSAKPAAEVTAYERFEVGAGIE